MRDRLKIKWGLKVYELRDDKEISKYEKKRDSVKKKKKEIEREGDR